MIYDCFAFFNELDVLEARLNIMDPYVDKFVLVEATRTFTNKEKPLYFENNKKRYEKFLHKIIHIIVDEYPTRWSLKRLKIKPWHFDYHQKEQILRGLDGCSPDDWIIVSDLDEIPNPIEIKKYLNQEKAVVFKQKLFSFYFNYVAKTLNNGEFENWFGPVMIKYKNIETIKKTRFMRDLREPDVCIEENGGWHFSFIGDVNHVIKKLESYAHTEFNYPEFKNPDRIREIIKTGKNLFGYENTGYFKIEMELLPKYLIENKHLYESNFIF